MVTTKLYGRTGNQLFQIAATIAYAHKHKLAYHIPANTENDEIWPPTITHLSNKNYDDRLPRVVLQEKRHDYQEIQFEEWMRDRNIILSGYWQSEKYFADYREEILEAFNFNWLGLWGTCGIHVRRGDYLQYPTKHPVVTEKYLDKAIDLMREKIDPTTFVFFGDDTEWLHQYASKLDINPYVISEERAPLSDLLGMACCQHQIISNSSFSWWAAWLNHNSDKIVLSPSKENWFGPDNAHLSTETLIPDTWLQIKY